MPQHVTTCCYLLPELTQLLTLASLFCVTAQQLAVLAERVSGSCALELVYGSYNSGKATISDPWTNFVHPCLLVMQIDVLRYHIQHCILYISITQDMSRFNRKYLILNLSVG